MSDVRDLRVDELGPDATVERVVRRALARSVIRLIDHEAGVRRGGDPEAVHQARVATRRLRSDLRTFRDVLDRRWAERLRRELRMLGSLLGQVRDAEVLLARLRGRAADLGPNDGRALDRLLTVLDGRRRAGRRRLVRFLRSRRYRRLLRRLVAAARAPRVRPDVAGAPARDELGSAMRRSWRRLRRAVALAGVSGSNVALHEVRIRAKRARYAAESLEGVFGEAAGAFARGAAALQDVLGEHQDAVVADAFLREAGAGSIAEAFVAGELAALEAAARREARAAWPAAWEALDRRRLRFWT